MEAKKHSMTAYRICDKIPLKQLPNIDMVAGATIVYKSSDQIELHTEDYRIYIFSFGAIAFFDCPQAQQEEIITRFLNEFSSLISGIQSDLSSVSDSINLRVSEKENTDFGTINVKNLNSLTIRIVAMLLSHSCVIDFYEQHVDNSLEASTNYLNKIRKRLSIPRKTKELTKFMVDSMQTRQSIITNLFVFDSPEEIWEDPYLDRVYNETKRMFDIASRFKTIDYKLKLIQDNLSLIANLAAARSNFWLELIIVLLILTEILIPVVKYFL